MYDRLPLDILELDVKEDICVGRCFLLANKKDQILGLLLEDTDTHITLGYPSRCYVGEDDKGKSTYEVVPYTRLPTITLPKQACPIVAPLHAESEYNFYNYLVNNIAPSQDFSTLLTKYEFDPVASCEHYLQRFFRVEDYCKKTNEGDTEEDLLESFNNPTDTLH